MHRIFVSMVACFLLALALWAAGQGEGVQEERGQEVLALALARYGEAGLRNLEREQRNILYGQDSEHPTMELHWRSLIDFENQRLLNEDFAGGRVVKRTSYVGGRAEVLDLGTDTVSVLAPSEHRFDSILARNPPWPAPGLSRAVYEGWQSYFGLVEGEQFALPGDDDKYLFDHQGRLIARVTPGEASGDAALTDVRLFEDERQVEGFWFPFLTRGYHVEGDGVTLAQEVRVLELVVDQELSDARFALRQDEAQDEAEPEDETEEGAED